MYLTKRLWIEIALLLLILIPMNYALWILPIFPKWHEIHLFSLVTTDFILLGIWALGILYFRHKFITWMQCGILTLWILLNLGVWTLSYFSYHQIYHETYNEFKNETNILLHNLEQRFKNPIYGLNGARGMLLANPQTNNQQFRNYVLSRDLQKEFYNIRGFGFIEKVMRSDYDQFEKSQQSLQSPFFKIKSTGNQPSLYVIKYIEPLENNRAAWGYDVGSEKMRRSAIEKSIALKSPILTSKITLVQDPLKRPAFLLFSPIFQEEKLLGVVYAPFILDDLLQDIGILLQERIDFELFINGKVNKANLIYDLDQHFNLKESTEKNYDFRLFQRDTTLDVYGQKFLCRLSSRAAFENNMDFFETWVVYSLGQIISILIIIFVIHIARTKERITRRANELSEGLLAAKENAEQALAENQDLLHALNQFANVIVLDKNTKITQVNMKFVELTGYGPMELLHSSYKVLCTENTELDFLVKLNKQITEGRIWRGDFCSKKKTSEIYWTDTIIVPLKDEKSEIYRYIVLQRDLTPLKYKEQQLLDLNRKLENQTTLAQNLAEAAQMATQAKSMFLANMSHEIRTPMNGIIGMIGLLLDTPLNAEQKAQAEIVRNSGELLLGLINDILDYSKVESGKMDLETIPFDLWQTLKDFHSLLNVRAQEKSIVLNLKIDSKVPQIVAGDPTRLRQILNNLVGNAIKFTSKGSVDISLNVDKHIEAGVLLSFKIKDSGIGIPENKMHYLFESFSQVDSSITRKFGGTGLGLVISKQLVELMGGKIHVESIEGHGSIFSFTICLSLSQETPITSTNENSSIQLRTEARILLAEDNLVNQKVAVGMLGKYGLKNVTVAANGVEVLNFLKQGEYDLIFMDMQMPEMDGLETTRQIRSQKNLIHNEIPIIAMTANAMSQDQIRCTEAGMNDYISKPIDRKELLNILQKWLPSS